ncbi:MAG: radical SAM protein [Candidatus Thorarchaeota archaeon]|jgi:MoaA/NifB/PqqE/SkfB family radical SAM enzyme
MKTAVRQGMIFKYNKYFKNFRYELFFNTKTGIEVLCGVKPKSDPFRLMLPSMCDIGIMGSCPNRCAFCYQSSIKEPHMKLKDFKIIIDQVKHHTNQVALGGRGDPNHHPHFKEILEYCVENNVVPNYTTSGKNLTDEQVELSKMCGAVAVSDYRKKFTFNAFNKFSDARIKTNIHFMLTRQTYYDALKILYGSNPWVTRTHNIEKADIKLEKINAVIFLLFKPQGNGKNLLDLIPTSYQLMVFAERVLDPKCQFKVGMDSCLVNHVKRFIGDLDPIQEMSIDTCESARMSTYISPSMKMIPCSFANHEKYGVPLEGTTIKEVWNKSEPFKIFRKRLMKNKNCCPIGL